MNDLNLRVSGGIGEKVKKPAAPLSMPYWNNEMPGVASDFFSNFLSSNSADNQLKLLKQFLNSHKDVCEQETIKFLVLLFWHADGKHPVKGFLKKHITDSSILNQSCTEILTSVIATEIKDSQSYEVHIGTITRLDTGTDKFPPGAAAVSGLEIDVTGYYVRCLETCISTLGLVEQNTSNEVKSEPVAPTEINKIYDLVHLTLRLLLYMIQKVTDENRGKLSSMFSRIRSIIAELMSGKEVPMDTKSVSGIIYLTLHLFEYGPGSWITLLKDDRSNESGTVNLSIYSAVATVVPPAELVDTQLNGQPAILNLTDKILVIGDRYSSESSHTLAVARTLLSISRALRAGVTLATRLARWGGAHLEHHVDSVRHLAAQLMGRVVAAADQLQTQGDPSVLDHIFAFLSTLDSSRKGFYVTLTAIAETMGAAVLVRRPDVIRDVIHGLRTQAVQACATTFLETLLKKHMKQSDTQTIYRQWICVILETVKWETDPIVLGILEKTLAKAVQWDSGVLQYILPDQRALSSYEGSDLKCILLVLGVVRKSGVAYKGVTFADLRHTAYDADDEIRILSLSLVTQTPRSTEPLSSDELAFTLLFLQYNINAQSPSFRQLLLAHMKKILKRLEDSYKVLKRKEAEHTAVIASYLQFASGLRAACFDSLAAGAVASYGRRCTALQVLSWLESLQLESDRTWTENQAEILYNLLEDSYDNNKALALEVLKNCPVELIKSSQPVNSAAEVNEITPFYSQRSEKTDDSLNYSQDVDAYLKYQEALLNPSQEIPLSGIQAKRVRKIAKKGKRKAKEAGLSSHVIRKVTKGKRLIKISISDIEQSNIGANCVTVQYVVQDDYDDLLNATEGLVEKIVKKLSEPVHSPEFVADAIAQASSVKPTDCVAASYKLLLLLSLPRDFELYHEKHDVPSAACYFLLACILASLKAQVSLARHIARAARDAPMYGLVHCLARLLGCLDARAIAGNEHWTALIEDIISTCEAVNGRVDCVVSAASPEGFLPDTQQDSTSRLRLADGRAVTAQMVLLCAWRSVKETSLLLGSIVSQLSLEGEAPAWTLSAALVTRIGEHLIALLATVKHRGAFEQAYVGLTLLLARLWKCKSGLHQLPLQWFSSVELGFVLPDGDSTELCPTRRGAGLPFMIQALVTTELAAESTAPRGRLLHRCLDLCLRVARAPPGPADAARAHLVLRALYRHTAPPAEHTAQAIMVAVRGFEADTWTERNSSTLLFSALVVRVFGVARSSGHKVSPRNTMTGRIFFLRYAQLYDFLLEQLKSVSPESTLRPSLFPTLLLLARLYPSALEGTVSNLKLSRFLPHLLSLSGARDVSTRRLAARAAAPLVSPHRCIAHMQSLLVTLGDPAMKRNLCHGLLCQLTVLLELKPAITVDETSTVELLVAIRGTFWIPQTCFLVADQWLKFINLVLLRFPKLLDDDVPTISSYLETILSTPAPTIKSGREVFLSNAAYMSFIISPTPALVLQCLQHTDYEVNLAALNYLLVLHGCSEDSCPFLEHLSKTSNKDVLRMVEKDNNYVKLICRVTENGYLECKQKALQVLALTNNTQKEIVTLKLGSNVELTDEMVIKELIDSIRNGHANLSSIYLKSLLSFASKPVLEVVRVMYECSGAGNEVGTREIVVGYLEKHLRTLMDAVPSDDEAERFQWRATLVATAAMLLEDDAPTVRQRAANAVLDATEHTAKSPCAISAYAARQWRRAAAERDDGAALLLTLAALDFCARVDTGDELGEESRVFDQNETHNVYLEEFTWSKECAKEMKRTYRQTGNTQTMEEYLQTILFNPTYKETIEKLCIDNVAEHFMGRMKTNNPKINLFLKILHE